MTRAGKTLVWATLLVAAAVVLVFLQAMYGPTRSFTADETWGAIAERFGVRGTDDAFVKTAVGLRMDRALTAAAVGASLALAGALLQGLFRNALASPSLIGVTSGAGLGAVMAILALGSHGAGLTLMAGGAAPYLVVGGAFVGALAVTTFVLVLATRGGAVSVPALLLIGVAVNACVGGMLAAIQALVLPDYEVSRAILAWSFGSLDDRQPWQVGLSAVGLVVALAIVPWVAVELDLFAGGEEDAAALGVSTRRTKVLVVVAATAATACATAVAGQIAFIGLVVPHLVRTLTGTSHRSLLWLAPPCGAVLLLGLDLAQLLLVGRRALPPGVVTALLGGPFFLFLLLRSRRGALGW
jgi:iron complex transport system permease protein